MSVISQIRSGLAGRASRARISNSTVCTNPGESKSSPPAAYFHRSAATRPPQNTAVLRNRSACLTPAAEGWLKAGTEPKRVADWAGHSVNVLLRIYTHCLDGGEAEARRRIQRTLEDAN